MRSRRGKQLDRIEQELHRLRSHAESTQRIVMDRMPSPAAEARSRWAERAEVALDLAINAPDAEMAKVQLKIAQACQEVGRAGVYLP